MHAEPYEILSEIYDHLMNSSFYKNYVRFIKGIIKNYGLQPKSILDVACGTGKLSKLLKDMGFEVVGIDSSKNMLKIAKKRGIKCYAMLMENFKLNKKFDMIISTYDSVNHLSEFKLKKFIKNVYRHLADKGAFVFDINPPAKINNLSKRGVLFFGFNNYDIVWMSGGKNCWLSKIIIYKKIKDSSYRKYVEVHKEYIHDPKRIISLLRLAGFDKVDVYADFNYQRKVHAFNKFFNRLFFVAIK